MKKFLKILTIVILVLLAILASLITKLDRTPYQEMAYYQNWKTSLNTLDIREAKSDSVLLGWSKVNITPSYSTPMAGYGKRKGEHFTTVHDSIYVRTICVQVGSQKQFLSSIDMLIVPPSVTEIIKKEAIALGFNFDQVYLSATHSHNSVGGWYDTLVGELFAGEYDPRIEQMVAKAVVESLKLSQKNLQSVKIKYEENIDTEDIYNRLVKDKGTIDPEIRSIKFIGKQDSVILSTYAAHSTVLDSKTMALSRDYPGVLVDELEKEGYAFASFMAGAVGSMGPRELGEEDFEQVTNQGNNIKTEVVSKPEKRSLNEGVIELKSLSANLPLRKASPKITPNLAMRPWVFKWLFGEYPAFIKASRIGNILLVGMPCDFSGELMADLDNYAQSKGLQLIVTSFNGAYAGYITSDQYFDLDNYETVTMSWFGPYNGAYFSEAIKDIINQTSTQ